MQTIQTLLRQWKPNPADIVILAGAMVNLLAISAILAYVFLGS